MMVFPGGCGGDGRVQISGVVTLDGVPIESGTIAFRPVDGSGPTAGVLISHGRYSARVWPGRMRVEIQGYKEVGQERALASDPDSPIVPKTEPIVPEKYNTKSILTIDVNEDAGDVDFRL